jgi:hypothetical protein
MAKFDGIPYHYPIVSVYYAMIFHYPVYPISIYPVEVYSKWIFGGIIHIINSPIGFRPERCSGLEQVMQMQCKPVVFWWSSFGGTAHRGFLKWGWLI